MLLAAPTPRRKLALGIALPWVAFSLLFTLYKLQFGVGRPFVNWHFAALSAWIAVSALASGLVVTELLRSSVSSASTWSDRRHFAIALIVSVALLAIQLISLELGFHATGARAF